MEKALASRPIEDNKRGIGISVYDQDFAAKLYTGPFSPVLNEMLVTAYGIPPISDKRNMPIIAYNAAGKKSEKTQTKTPERISTPAPRQNDVARQEESYAELYDLFEQLGYYRGSRNAWREVTYKHNVEKAVGDFVKYVMSSGIPDERKAEFIVSAAPMMPRAILSNAAYAEAIERGTDPREFMESFILENPGLEKYVDDFSKAFDASQKKEEVEI